MNAGSAGGELACLRGAGLRGERERGSPPPNSSGRWPLTQCGRERGHSQMLPATIFCMASMPSCSTMSAMQSISSWASCRTVACSSSSSESCTDFGHLALVLPCYSYLASQRHTGCYGSAPVPYSCRSFEEDPRRLPSMWPGLLVSGKHISSGHSRPDSLCARRKYTHRGCLCEAHRHATGSMRLAPVPARVRSARL